MNFQTLGEVLKENKKLQNQVDDLTNQLNVTNAQNNTTGQLPGTSGSG